MRVLSKPKMISTLDFFLDLAFILLSWLIWHLLWEWLVLEMGRGNLEGLLIVSVLQAVATVAAYLVDANILGNWHEDIRPNNLIEKVHMITSVGFYLHDTPHWQPRISLTNVTMLFHHLLTLIALTGVIIYGSCGDLLLELAVLFELPTPLLLVRYYQKEAGYATKATDLSYLFFFVLLRFWFGSNLTLLIMQNEGVPNSLKVLCSLIFVTSLCLLPGVMKMALGRRRPTATSGSRGRTPSTCRGQRKIAAKGRNRPRR